MSNPTGRRGLKAGCAVIFQDRNTVRPAVLPGTTAVVMILPLSGLDYVLFGLGSQNLNKCLAPFDASRVVSCKRQLTFALCVMT